MKKSIAIPILCTLLLLALLSPSKGDPKFCPTTMQISGSCGPNGAFECFEAINAKYGASAMAQSEDEFEIEYEENGDGNDDVPHRSVVDSKENDNLEHCLIRIEPRFDSFDVEIHCAHRSNYEVHCSFVL
ncbi:hypothetical protein Gotur_022298 [Gossypium turneri]